MVAVFNKELLSWYLITLKLKETVEANLPQHPPDSNSDRLPITDHRLETETLLPPPLPPSPTSPAPTQLDSQWIISIRKNLERARQYEASSPWSTLSIYRIPKSLRDVDEMAYAPQIVSLGPYHRGRRRLRHMERHKWRAFHHALDRAGHDVNLYLDAGRELESRARACYEGPLSLSADAFVECLILDSIFALELFNDPVFAVRGTMHSLQRDMILLENQIPLFVLDRILALQLGHDPSRSGAVAAIALRFFDPLMPTNEQLIHCVTELRNSGIKFRRRMTGRFWDIKFKDGVMRIPRLLIHDGTKSLFLNLIAFEQCNLECSNHITSYVIFMDNLINSEEDVGYLHYRGIIEHWLGNDGEVADLFNRLCQEVVFDINDSFLSGLSEQVNSYYNHRWNAWRASLRHKYFGNPWAIVSLVAAVVLLLLTFAQTFYSVYGYYKPR
ncbi:UPF0481 protein [Platanthera zijinensis]|uniref:UPF0481 protein n=1 Tax=Platanthera zijinensis TaxID=2320716 RepID=A0AAP0B7N6_9ASPA